MTTALKRRRARLAERLAEKHLPGAPPKPGRPPMAFFYVRYSTIEQSNGYSEAMQIAEIERVFQAEYAPRGYVKAPSIYLDAGKSAFKIPFPKRDAAARLMADVQKGDVVLVYKIDRCFRRVVDCAQTVEFFKKQGVRIRATDFDLDYESAMGEAMLNMMSTFAQLESRMKSDRVKAANRIARQNGVNFGPKPEYVETVQYQGRKPWCIKAQYVDALDWLAKEMRKRPRQMQNLPMLREARRRMAAADGKAFDGTEYNGLSPTRYYSTFKPRFQNWSKETGKTIEVVRGGVKQTRWLFPPAPENEQTQED